MNSINGLEIANTLPRECCFIFTTAYARYALEGFNLDAVDFLLKPFSYDRFEQAIEKALRRIETHRSLEVKHLVVKQEYNNVSISFADILYIEAMGNYVKIIRVSGGYVLTRTNLKAISELLPDKIFLRIHRSYIIAIAAVDSFTKTRVTLKNFNKTLPVGSQYATHLLKAMKK